jgi:formamidopyrimidine-DNA glycosylase
MPELPEVETIARGLETRVRGRRIVTAWFGEKPGPCKSPAEEMLRALMGRYIQRAHRVGKHIVFDLAQVPKAAPVAQWLVHLGMTGRMLVAQPGAPLPAHTHAVLQLDDQREVRFVDPRRFGRLSVFWPRPNAKVPVNKAKNGAFQGFTGTGREPLEVSDEEFYSLFHPRHAPIKALLLNQSLLQGIGNIYADEGLFRARVRPQRRANRLTWEEMRRLRRALQSVLRQAIAQGGSSVSDYVDAEGVEGLFQLQHRVYQRTGAPCRVCKTAIRRIVLAGRSTHYCPHCQH